MTQWKILRYFTDAGSITFNPMVYSKRKLSWITTLIMVLSIGFIFLAFKFNSWFLIFLGWFSAWVSGQFWFIVTNWDDLKETNIHDTKKRVE